MNESEFETPVTPPGQAPVENSPDAATPVAEVAPVVGADGEPPVAVNPARSAAGRLGAQRVHKLAELGREYEREKGLTPGRQRLRQLIQLGKRYEVEHGLRATKPRRKRRGDAWAEFLAALARVVKPAYRPAVERLVRALAEPEQGERSSAA